MRRFVLLRHHDHYGSCVMVAEGIRFSDDRCVIQWRHGRRPYESFTAYEDVRQRCHDDPMLELVPVDVVGIDWDTVESARTLEEVKRIFNSNGDDCE